MEHHTEGKKSIIEEGTTVGGEIGEVWTENREGFHRRAGIKPPKVKGGPWVQGTHRQRPLRGLNGEKCKFQGSVTEGRTRRYLNGGHGKGWLQGTQLGDMRAQVRVWWFACLDSRSGVERPGRRELQDKQELSDSIP